MATSFNDANFEKKLTNVANTQDGIQTLSLWIIHHKAHYKAIVEMWLTVLKRAKVSHRLTLFNLANDVIQNSRRKGFNKFVESFGQILKVATPLVRDDKVLPSIQRIYRIWEERSIYDGDMVKELNDILDKKATADRLIADFKFSSLSEQLRACAKLFLEVESKFQVMKNQKVDASSFETLTAVKDRSLGQQFSTDFEESTNCLETYVELLSNAVNERKKVLELLEVATIYYDSQRNEARIVANAYKNFGGKIKLFKKKLVEKLEFLPSPIASPNINAPSPSPSETAEDLFGETDDKGGESPPSPEGTPEEFRFSPASVEEDVPDFATLTSASATDDELKTDEPIPAILTSQDDGSMAVSLDSRLTNLMENMSSLPQSLLGTLFGNTGTVIDPVRNKDDNLSAPGATEGTPLNDEPAGHETPLQDETDAESHSNDLNQGIESRENMPTGMPFPNLVRSNVQTWPEPDRNTNWLDESTSNYPSSSTFPWEVAKIANTYADKDERILKGVDMEPMDMELDDEIENTSGAIIEATSNPAIASNGELNTADNNSGGSCNLITVVNTDSRPSVFNELSPISEQSTPAMIPQNTSQKNVAVPDTFHSVEPDNDLLHNTQKLMEPQISSDEFCDSANDDEPYQEHSLQNFQNNQEQTMQNFKNQEQPVQNFQNQEQPVQNFQNQEQPVQNFQNQEQPVQNFQNQEQPVQHFQNQEQSVQNFQNQEQPVQNFQNQEPLMQNFQNPEQQIQNFPKNPLEQNFRKDHLGLISYPERHFYRSQNSNYRPFGNNNWANNMNAPRRSYRSRPRFPHGYSPYRPSPPRWRY